MSTMLVKPRSAQSFVKFFSDHIVESLALIRDKIFSVLHVLLIKSQNFNTYASPKLNYNHTRTEVWFNWSFLVPAQSLEYSPCHKVFLCARLLVPADWDTNGSTSYVKLAVIKMPSGLDPLSPRYGGDIWFNPGGPGVSGVEFLVERGFQSQNIVNTGENTSSDGLLYDLMSFDPRGVMHSKPRLSCFRDVKSRELWYQEQRFYDSLSFQQENLNQTISRKLARMEALSKTCIANHDAQTSIHRHVSTAQVARDLLELVEQAGKWRDAEALPILRTESKDISITKNHLPDNIRHHSGKESLNYWGFSYGTIVGATFASLYPARVSRMILDGVANPDEWALNKWDNSYRDLESALGFFYHSCFAAGPTKCPIYQAAGPTKIKEVVENTLSNLEHAPLVLWNSHTNSSKLLTSADMVSLIYSALSSPDRLFLFLAEILAEIQWRQTEKLAERLQTTFPQSSCNDYDCKLPDCIDQEDLWFEANLAVVCTDGPDLQEEDFKCTVEYVKNLQRYVNNEQFAQLMADVRLACIHWPFRPVRRFAGPFEGKTAHPILWIGNAADPVSPVTNAQAPS